MFTGIIESIGILKNVLQEGTNKTFVLESDISDELKTDQSVSHNGVCLTVTQVEPGNHSVTAVKETLERSNLGSIKEGDQVNLERCMKVDGRLDGHMVQGHIDKTAVCINIIEEEGSWLMDFEFDQTGDQLLVEKGAISVNGISLTCYDVTLNSFRVTIIPYTFTNTNFNKLRVGDKVNLEFDVLGKYIKKLFEMQDFTNLGE